MLLLICQLPNGKMTHIEYSSSFQCYMINFNGLPDRLNLMCKIFVDDTPFFSKANDKSDSNSQLNPDLTKISKWSFQWKMSFNPDPNKQAIEVCFSNKRDKGNDPPLHFNCTDVRVADSQKNSGLVLDYLKFFLKSIY